MCKLTKTGSPVLSLFLETEYVNAVATRGYAVRPNLTIPTPTPAVTRPAGGVGPAARE